MTLSELRSAVRFSVFGDSNEDTYSDTDIDRNINLWYKTALTWILQSNGDWQVNSYAATTNIVSGQRKYQIPTDIMKINQVYIKYSEASEYYRAYQVDPQNIRNGYDPDSFPYTPFPPEFDLRDGYIYIYTPEETIGESTSGLKIHYQTKITELSGTSDEPNLAEPFERILINGAAYEYSVAQGLAKSEQLKRDINELKVDLLKHYSNRSEVKKHRLVPEDVNYDDNY